MLDQKAYRCDLNKKKTRNMLGYYSRLGIWSIIKDKGVYFQEKMLEKQREIKPLRRKTSLSFCVVGSKDSSTFPSKRNENTLLEPQ